MGQLLLILIIGDINARAQHASALSFADETRIMVKVNQPEDSNKLQDVLNAVHQ